MKMNDSILTGYSPTGNLLALEATILLGILGIGE
jgi:hypothetical protein